MANFTSKANGNWNAASQTTWNEVGTPATGDNVSIGAHNITLTQAETCGSLVGISGGTLTGGGFTLTCDDDGSSAIVFQTPTGFTISGVLDLDLTGGTARTIDTGNATGNIRDLTVTGNVIFTLANTELVLDRNCIITTGSTLDTGANLGLTVTGVTSITGTLTCNASAISTDSNVNINSGGTFTSTSATWTHSGGDINNNAGTFTHNSGTVIFDRGGSTDINYTNTTPFVFNNVTSSGASTRINISRTETIEGTLTIAASTTFRMKGTHTAILTMGTAGTAGTIANSGTFEFNDNATNQASIIGANASYPCVCTGTDWDWDTVVSSKVGIGLLDYQITMASGGVGVTIAQTAANIFDAVTITAGDTFALNGYEMTYSGALSTPGTFTGSATSILTQIGVGASWTQAQDITLLALTVTNTQSTDGYNITTKTITNNGTLALNTNAAPRQTSLIFPDIAGAGFAASTGTLICTGTAGQGVTITSAGAPPTNYWDFATTMSITADYTTFEYYVTGETSGTVDIDNCTFRLNESNSGFEVGVGGTLTSFTDNTLDQCAGDEAFSSLVAHNAFDNIVITNNTATEDIRAGDVLLEFNNSNFDITAVDLDTSGNIISRNHNDVTDDYKVAATTLTYSNINTEPTETSNIRLYEGTWNFDYDDADNKACLTFKVDAGTTVKAEDHVDFYIINKFDLNGTWDKSAGYAGIFHIGQPTWDGVQWIDWKNWIGEPFIDFVQWLEFDI